MSLEKPPDYRPPPPPPLADVVRTARVAAIDLPRHLARLALHRVLPTPSTTTAEGLANVGRAFARTLDRLAIELEVLHQDRVPREGGLNLMWNQESHLDHLVLAAAIPRPFFSLFNNAVARVPFYGSHMRATGHVHVDRNDESQWRPAIARAAARVAAGECVLVSPEGTRSWDGRLLPMKRGALLLASESLRPIVCCTVIGGHARMPRGSPVVRRGTIRVVFSQPLANDGDPTNLADAVARTFDRLKDEHALNRI